MLAWIWKDDAVIEAYYEDPASVGFIFSKRGLIPAIHDSHGLLVFLVSSRDVCVCVCACVHVGNNDLAWDSRDKAACLVAWACSDVASRCEIVSARGQLDYPLVLFHPLQQQDRWMFTMGTGYL